MNCLVVNICPVVNRLVSLCPVDFVFGLFLFLFLFCSLFLIQYNCCIFCFFSAWTVGVDKRKNVGSGDVAATPL